MITNAKLEDALKKGMSLIRNSRSNCALRCKKKMTNRLQIMKVFMIKILEEHIKTPGFCNVDEQGNCMACNIYDELRDHRD